jgi:hypothetical protein
MSRVVSCVVMVSRRTDDMVGGAVGDGEENGELVIIMVSVRCR